MSSRLPLVLAAVLLGPLTASGAAPPDGPSAREVLAAFDRDDPGWKARMRALVRIARLGPDAVPPLVESLGKGSPTRREFAAQALGMFTDPRAKPALEKALKDPKETVRDYAVQALRLMGPLEPAAKWEKLRSDADRGFRSTVAGALDSKAQPSAEAVRRERAGYDLAKMDSARVGQLAPDFALAARSGKAHRLSDYRGKKEVVLRYFKLDY